MSLGLGLLELRVFETLCFGPQSEYGKNLASRSGLKESSVSRALKALAGKKLVALERKGKRKFAAVSDAPHALALKAFFAAYPHVDAGVLAYSSIRVLSGLLFPNASVARVKRVGFVKEITVRRVLAKLLDAGIVGRRNASDYYILLPFLRKAVEEHVSFAVTQSKREVNGSLVSRGPYGFIRTSAEVPKFMKPTGLSVLSEFGVKVIQTDFKDYYYNVFGVVKKPSLEEAVAHVLLRSTLLPSSREASYALLALHKNRKKFNEKKFLAVASDLGAESAARQSLGFVENFITGHEEAEPSIAANFLRVEGPIFPSVEEFRELVKEYG